MNRDDVIKGMLLSLSDIFEHSPEAVKYIINVMDCIIAFEKKWPEAKDDVEEIWNAVLNITKEDKTHD